MGGKAFKEKYSIQKVNKEVANHVVDLIKDLLPYEHAAVGNTENVMLGLIEETGDIDIIINADKNDLFEALEIIKCCVDKRKIANNVLTVFSYGGKFYQVDFLTTPNIELGKWLMKGNANLSGVKGAMRNMLFGAMLKNTSDACSEEGVIKTKFALSFPGSLKIKIWDKDENLLKESEALTEKQVRSCLFLSTNKKYKYDTFESVVDYLLDNNIYTHDSLLNMFESYTEKSWTAKQMPEEREKGIEYIKSKQIRTNS